MKYCLKASGHGAPPTLSKSERRQVGVGHPDSAVTRSPLWSADFNIELVLDRLKQKEATKRVLFLHSRTVQYSKNMAVSNGKAPSCEEQFVFLRVSSRAGGTAPPPPLQQQANGSSLMSGRPGVPR